ncbi:MAG: molybdenum cofactor biosynthesis protein B [Nitrososphaerales archaeon]
MKAHEEHRARAKAELSFHLVTVSTSRFKKMKAGERFEDASGDLLEAGVLGGPHELVKRELIPDDAPIIRSILQDFLSGAADVLVFTGGTGVAPTDVTIETARPFFEKELPGFGEVLRAESFGKIGSAAALTRATAGTARGKLVVCLPGAPDAVETALKIFLPEFPHIVSVARS